jgi:hypothetical protein
MPTLRAATFLTGRKSVFSNGERHCLSAGCSSLAADKAVYAQRAAAPCVCGRAPDTSRCRWSSAVGAESRL